VAKSRQRKAPPAQRLILDSGAVIGLSRNDERARAALVAAWEAGVEVLVPAVVLAETVRSSAEGAPVKRVLKAIGEVIPVDAQVGRAAGGLLGAARSSSTIDALVVASAARIGGGVILTGDADDLTTLARGHQAILIEAL
jgi:predicted nucleic acid-binding protein